MDERDGRWGGTSVEMEKGVRLRPVAVWTRRLAAYKPKREEGENKNKNKNKKRREDP
jgi:hypothetical protein